MLAGVVGAAVLVPLTMLPGGQNAFGPPKVLALTLSSVLIALGFAFDPSRLELVLRRAARSRVGLSAGAFLLVVVLSLVTSVDRVHSVLGSYPEYQGIATLLCWALVLLGAASVAPDGRMSRFLLRAITLGLLLVSVYAVLQRLGLDPYSMPRGATVLRVRSVLGNSSNLGVYLLLTLPVALHRWRVERDSIPWRAVSLAAVTVGFLALIWTASRGAWLGFAAGAAAFALLEVRGRAKEAQRRLWLAAGAAVLLVLLVFALTPKLATRAMSVADLSRGTGRWRLVVWQTSLDAMADRPVLGWGPNTLRFVYPSFRREDAWDAPIEIGTVANAHNVIVHSAVSYGGAGALSLLALWVVVGLTLWRLSGGADGERRSDLAPMLGASLVGFAVAVMFHYPTLDTGSLVAALLGLLVGCEVPAEAKVRGVGQSSRPAIWRVSAVMMLAIAALMFVAAVGLVAADRLSVRALAAANAGAPWSKVRGDLAAAQRLAPWEVAYRRMWAQAAMLVPPRSFVAATLKDASRGLGDAERMQPLDPAIVGDRADLMVAAALVAQDASLLRGARAAYQEAIRRDPNNAVYWIGLGRVDGLGGDDDGAIEAFTRAAVLSPRTRQTWTNLAKAYEAQGRWNEAYRAAQLASVAGLR